MFLSMANDFQEAFVRFLSGVPEMILEDFMEE